ncbi:MAG: tetratricopeptide repeat protein [Phycisphaeraceae bacterium]|nr:tetratricopeptide repeat protein [Phycisphaeraceae bacterium]
MALFGKKSTDDGAQSAPATGDVYLSEPDKAASFFEHARTVGQTGNYEYATTLWLQGLRKDPSSMTGLESFYTSAARFAAERGKPGPTKDQARNFGGKDFHKGVERYLLALLDFGTRSGDINAAIRAMAAASAIDQAEAAYWIGERALNFAAQDPKVKKDQLLKIKEAAERVGAFDMAVKAGEFALSKDRTDAKLADELRNLSAQATMSAGGYTEQGSSFRTSVRDAAKQQALNEGESVVKSVDAAQRVLNAAREDYESRPTDRHAVSRYVRALLENENEANEATAIDVLDRAYNDTQEYQFRKEKGRLQIRQAKRAERRAASDCQADPTNKDKAEALRGAQQTRQNIELEVVEAHAEAYPTDLGLKFELGKLYYNAGRDKQAITLLQQAVKDAKNRIDALDYLGRAFNRIGFVDESISVLRQAIEAERSSGTHVALDRQYALMCALMTKAENDRDTEAINEAAQLASAIAMEQLDYQDILERRQAIQDLQKKLRDGG